MTDTRETWTWRELPILREVVRRADDGDQMIELVEIQDATGLDDTAVIVGVDALADDDYFDLLRRAR